ncbi:adenylate/guanylate cyclase domain-containing protein [Simiduia agarivorans]|uniref:Adenylate/guanylate cyclase n=1 Tax=Simiduia agarivorans (strain DSM 21679 / JCM 13881 / BCRC 17597 / SA1) TaxID=1117647 RepID=K4KJ29_SIMAS|nr:adenylate/guanylate cyclase domain-containing protein [Simiduia agarivorans]AFU98175.1 hypothetical protein M5M_04840 [Simiduia agarivorans SA1 = DSM 21679]
MPDSPTQRAILFADICGSSGLYKALGNHAAEMKIRELLGRVISAVADHKGTVIKTIGDEVMASFAKPAHALTCSQAIQRQFHRSAGALQLRLGASYGDVVINEQQDVFGDTVNDAAFVARIARAEEIIVTHGFFQALPDTRALECREFDRVSLKGGDERQMIYRVQWQSETSPSATQVMNLVHTTQQIKRQLLTLQIQDQPLQIGPEDTPFHLGRSDQNSAVVDSQFASREHCHILYRRGKYVLIDHSTNGTYVQPDGHREIYLRREELPLEGQGQFSLGQPVSANDCPLHYHNKQH